MIARRFQTLLTRTHGLRRVGLTCWSAALISGSWGMAPSISFAQQPPPVEVPTPAPAPVPLPEDPPLPTPIVPIPEVPPIPEAATLPATAATSAPARVAVRPAQDGQAEPGNLPQALPNAAAENTPPLPEEVADPKMSAKELENLTPYTNIPNPRPITGQIAELFELIQDPSVELSVVVGRGKVIQLREQPLRFILGNPRIATLSFPPSDVQSLAQLDRPSDARLFVVYGIQAGTTTLTIWDKNNVPTTFLVRVSVDTLDIQNQIRAVFPGTDVTVRQSANQIILEGQVPDTKTMNEVIRLVNGLLVSNQAGEVRAQPARVAAVVVNRLGRSPRPSEPWAMRLPPESALKLSTGCGYRGRVRFCSRSSSPNSTVRRSGKSEPTGCGGAIIRSSDPRSAGSPGLPPKPILK